MMVIAMMNRVLGVTGAAFGGAARVTMPALHSLRRIAENRAQVRALAGLDERGLHDIVLSRADVQGALDTSVFADPSLLLCKDDSARRALVSLHQRGVDRGYGTMTARGDQAAATLSQMSFQIGQRSGRESIA
jgi:uncharacterized protein YjiS (DUF1127 family)